MLGRSALDDRRRRQASQRISCALAALALSLSAAVGGAAAQSGAPTLQPAIVAQADDTMPGSTMDSLPMSTITPPESGGSTAASPSNLTPAQIGPGRSLPDSSLTQPEDGIESNYQPMSLPNSSLTAPKIGGTLPSTEVPFGAAPPVPVQAAPASTQPMPPQPAPPAKPVIRGSTTASVAVSGDLTAALARPGDLTLRNSSLQDALFTISELWHINIVAGDVTGSVNGVFKNAPLREILDSILLSNGYAYRTVGDSLVVSPLDDVGQVNPFFESATIPVHSADIDEVVEGARLLSTPQGMVRPMKSARSMVVLDYPDRVNMIRQFVASIDGASRLNSGVSRSSVGQPLEVAYFRTQYIPARTAGDALQAVISKEGRLGVLDKEDRIVVTDYAENLLMIGEVLKRIDRARPQVRITALIYDLSLQDIEELGINWRSAVGNNPLFTVDSVMKVPFDLTPDGGGPPSEDGSAITFMNLSPHFDLNAVILALQTAKDSRLLANPNVAVLENEEALFQSVSEIPYQQLTQTQQGGQIGTTAFKDAGITLRVIPKISSDGTVEMKVTPEFSRLTGFTPGDNQPIIDRRSASTTLAVANKQTVVIGGLRQRNDVGDFKGIPYLKDARLIGRLFRSRDTDVRESELVVFINPEIIGPADPPTCREQLVADTLRYRLDMVPQPEGLPPGYQCQCGPVEMAPGEQYAPRENSTLPTPTEAVPGTQMLPPGESPWRPQAVPAQPPINSPWKPQAVPPQPANKSASAGNGGMASNGPSVETLVAQGRLKRLPPVGSVQTAVPVAATVPAATQNVAQPAVAVAALPEEKSGKFLHLPKLTEPSMRKDFDERYRTTGDSGPVQVRRNPDGTMPAAEEKKEGLWQRMKLF